MRKALSRRSTLLAPLGLFMTRGACVAAEEHTAEPAFADTLRPLIAERLKVLLTPGAMVLRRTSASRRRASRTSSSPAAHTRQPATTPATTATRSTS